MSGFAPSLRRGKRAWTPLHQHWQEIFHCSPSETMNKPGCPLQRTAMMWMQHEVLLKIYSKLHTFPFLSLLSYLLFLSLHIANSPAHHLFFFFFPVWLWLCWWRWSRARGGTFEVGQVAAGNAESFMQTGSSRWERGGTGHPGSPSGNERGETEEGKKKKKGGGRRRKDGRRSVRECEGDSKKKEEKKRTARVERKDKSRKRGEGGREPSHVSLN